MKENDGKNGFKKPSQSLALAAEERDDGDDLEMALANDDYALNAEGPIAEPISQSEPQRISPVPQAHGDNFPRLQSPEHLILTQNVSAVRSEVAGSESIRVCHQPTTSLQSAEVPSLSATDAANYIPQTTVDDSVEDLLGWFSSFVDMGRPNTSVTSDDEPAMSEVEEGFCQLQEKLYLNHWRTTLLKILPDPFAQLEKLEGVCSALRPAIIALSACDLAQARTDVRRWTINQEKRWLLSPNTEHQSHGRRYYSLARRNLAQLDYSKQEPTSLIATLILFTHIESHIGSYQAAAFHHHGIEHLLFARRGFCDHSVLAKDLVRVWTSLRAQNWRYRIPFTVPDFQKSLAVLGLDARQLLDPSEARDEAVMVNTVQSWRLSLMMLFERYAGRGDMESISARCCRDYFSNIPLPVARQPWTPKEPILDEDYQALLAEQQVELDSWYAALLPSHLPCESQGSESTTQEPPQLGQPPLRFISHQAAMNYVYLAAARIFQSREGIDQFIVPPHLSTHHSAQPDRTGVDYWVQLLLRIISGLDMAVCARHNSYAPGVLEILHMCHLRLPRSSQTIRSAADYMITEYEKNCVTHEGLHPILGFRHLFEAIERQRNIGRDLFYIAPRFSPDSQRQLTYDDAKPYVVYGRDQSTGKLFCQFLR
jgi:hypothetical protein